MTAEEISKDTDKLLKDIKKMELRNLNLKIVSNSMGIAADFTTIAVGTTLAIGLAGITLTEGVVDKSHELEKMLKNQRS